MVTVELPTSFGGGTQEEMSCAYWEGDGDRNQTQWTKSGVNTIPG